MKKEHIFVAPLSQTMRPTNDAHTTDQLTVENNLQSY